jgi:hypothetical protein
MLSATSIKFPPLTFDGVSVEYAEKILGQKYGDMGFWLALAMIAVYIPLLGRLAAKHFFGKDSSLLGIGLVGLISLLLTFGAIAMADTSLSAFVPKSVQTLVISLCAGTVILLVTSASAQVLNMNFGPSLGLQLIFWNIVLLSRLATKFLTDLWNF